MHTLECNEDLSSQASILEDYDFALKGSSSFFTQYNKQIVLPGETTAILPFHCLWR